MIFVQLPIKIQVFYAPELARPLQMTVCTLTFAKHTIILGPERVYCRRQLRSIQKVTPESILTFFRHKFSASIFDMPFFQIFFDF